MSVKKFIIEDWAGNRMFPEKTFDTFEDGWEFVDTNVDNSDYEQSGDENDNAMQDIFVVVEK